MMPNSRSALKASSFCMIASGCLGSLWLGLAMWFDPRSGGLLGSNHDWAGIGVGVGLIGGLISGAVVGAVIVLGRLRPLAATGIGVAVGFLVLGWFTYGGDPYYARAALILIPGGALIGAGTARILGRA